jgi:hypothetical protein
MKIETLLILSYQQASMALSIQSKQDLCVRTKTQTTRDTSTSLKQLHFKRGIPKTHFRNTILPQANHNFTTTHFNKCTSINANTAI